MADMTVIINFKEETIQVSGPTDIVNMWWGGQLFQYLEKFSRSVPVDRAAENLLRAETKPTPAPDATRP